MDEEVMQSPSAQRPTGSPAIQGREQRGASDESLIVQMILSNFYRREDDAKVRAIEVASWLRVLSGRTAIDILAAWEAYQKRGPRDQAGRLIKPTPHDIERRISQQSGAAPAGTGPAITEPMRKAAAAIIEKDREVSSFLGRRLGRGRPDVRLWTACACGRSAALASSWQTILGGSRTGQPPARARIRPLTTIPSLWTGSRRSRSTPWPLKTAFFGCGRPIPCCRIDIPSFFDDCNTHHIGAL